MKSAIDNYYSQSLQGSSCTDPLSVPQGKGSIKISSSSASVESRSSKSNGENCKENRKKLKAKVRSNPPGEVKKSSASTSPAMMVKAKKKISRKVKKKKTDSKDVDEDSACNKTEKSPPNFSFKIKIKSAESSECVIEEFSSPERVDSAHDSKSANFKSPQVTMLKYLIPSNQSSPDQKENKLDSKIKVNREISDFFRPKPKESSAILNCDGGARECEMPSSDFKKNEVKLIPVEKTEQSLSKKAQSKPTSDTAKSEKVTEKSEEEERKRVDAIPIAVLSDKIPFPNGITDKESASPDSQKSSNQVTKSKSIKPIKKSLSLLKTEVSGNNEPIVPKEGFKVSDDTGPSRSNIVQSLQINLKNIILKSSVKDPVNNKVLECPQAANTICNKRKRGKDNVEVEINKLLKTEGDDSPVKPRQRFSKTNNIDSDSDSETLNMLNSDELSMKTKNDSDGRNGMSEVTTKVEDSKRNSLMNYFSKVSKEEVLAKAEKVELKVKAMVHSPPTTPSKKEKRRSIKSLPGGGALFSAKKGSNIKIKLKENMNAIDVISVEDVKGNEIKVENFHSPQLRKKKQLKDDDDSAGSTDHRKENQNLKLRKSAKDSLMSSKSTSSPDGKAPKRSLSRKKAKVASTIKCDSQQDAEAETVPIAGSTDKDLASPLTNSENGLQSDNLNISSSQALWKMRVCLPHQGIPSSQGTLLEEDSDNEEIFLSQRRKKRKVDKQCVSMKSDQLNEAILNDESSSSDVIFEKESCREVKIAPLFTRKADSQARQQFLQSGVPDQVKRLLETHRSFEEQELETELFPKHSHIQQRNGEDWVWNLSPVDLDLLADVAAEVTSPPSTLSVYDNSSWVDLMKVATHIHEAICKGPKMCVITKIPTEVAKPILRLIKKDAPDFKVVNTYKALRSKSREEEIVRAAALSACSETQRPKRKSSNRKSLNPKNTLTIPTYRARTWTEKYRPCTASEIVGNAFSVQQLKQWLEAWRKASADASKLNCKEEKKHKRKRKSAIDDDDFVVSDESSDEGNSNLPPGAAVLHGPNGSGKTCTVYALAQDLGFKVLEVNASEKRNGKLVLSRLSEATQSHQLQQGGTAEQGFAALFGNQSKTTKRKKPKAGTVRKHSSDLEDDKAKKMSLILFEDVDLVFEEEDEGFLSAISSLISTSKRPVILTTTDPDSSYADRFMNSSCLVLKFSRPFSLMSTWLQIVALVEGVFAAPDAVKRLVSICKGDFRRALLQLQLWVMSGGNNLSMPSLTISQKSRKSSKSDDDLSENDDDGNHEPSIPANPDCTAALLGWNESVESSEANEELSAQVQKSPSKIPCPLDLGLYWWNMPPMLSLKQIEHESVPVLTESPPTSRTKRLLDDSFIATFCFDVGEESDNSVNEDSGGTCSQDIKDDGSDVVEKTSSNTSPQDRGDSVNSAPCSQQVMSAIMRQMVCLSTADLVSASSRLTEPHNVEPLPKFSCHFLKDSLSLLKSNSDGPNCVLKSLAEEICHCLGVQSLIATRDLLDKENPSPQETYNPSLPSQEEFNWRNAHAETEKAILAAIPLSMLLEQRALSTDYLPTLRSLCRLEQNRSTKSNKRHSRFYHYLKNTVASLTDSQLEMMCKTFYN